VACSCGQTCLAGTCITTGGQNKTDAGATDAGTEDAGTDAGVSCPPVSVSVCGKTASLIRGVARLDPDVTPPAGAAGTLVIALTHRALGETQTGGVFHSMITFPDVDLAAGPVPFSIDMCQGGEMWSEENGGFNLIAILDTNGNNQQFDSLQPDPGEAAMRGELEISCHMPSPCLDVELNCVTGAGCVAFSEPPGCGCSQPACNSPINACCP
jgi:hypothetical protein